MVGWNCTELTVNRSQDLQSFLERYLKFKLCAISPHLVQSHPDWRYRFQPFLINKFERLDSYEILKFCGEMSWRCLASELRLNAKTIKFLSSFFPKRSQGGPISSFRPQASTHLRKSWKTTHHILHIDWGKYCFWLRKTNYWKLIELKKSLQRILLILLIYKPKCSWIVYSFSSNPEGEWKNCQRVLKFLPLIFGSETSKQVKWVRNVRVDYIIDFFGINTTQYFLSVI
jgi:hypothetical protein